MSKHVPARGCSQTIHFSSWTFPTTLGHKMFLDFKRGTKTLQTHRSPILHKWENHTILKIHMVCLHPSCLRVNTGAWEVGSPFNETVVFKCQVTFDDVNRKERKGSWLWPVWSQERWLSMPLPGTWTATQMPNEFTKCSINSWHLYIMSRQT